jgi:hypothetical protein
MTVEIDAGAVTQASTGATASATRIRYASELLGPVAMVDSAGGRFTLLGQTVEAGATTVFDDRLNGGLAALQAGSLVEVHAAFDPSSGRYRATRIDLVTSAAAYRLRGVVSQLDSAARSLRIGTANFSYATAAGVPAGLANGVFVRLQLQPAAAGSSQWTVLGFGSATRTPPDGLEAKVKGLITSFSSTAEFSVNGQRINAGSASFPDGTAGLVPGARVEVEGSVAGGVLRADKVSIESDDEERDRGFELKGSITALNLTAKTLLLRGVLVSYASPTVQFKNGTVADLALNKHVEIKGVLAGDGISLLATEVEFDD